MLARSGIRIFKYWFSVTEAEQELRFAARSQDPLKQWNTADVPWNVVKSDDKKRARLNCMQHFLAALDYPDKNTHVVHGPDPLIVGPSSQVIKKDSHLWG